MPIDPNVQWNPWPAPQEPKDTTFKRIVRYTVNPGRLGFGLILAWLLTYWNFHGHVSSAHFWETYATWPVACIAWAAIVETHRWAGGKSKLDE
jgi:hypothetical protein